MFLRQNLFKTFVWEIIFPIFFISVEIADSVDKCYFTHKLKKSIKNLTKFSFQYKFT